MLAYSQAVEVRGAGKRGKSRGELERWEGGRWNRSHVSREHQCPPPGRCCTEGWVKCRSKRLLEHFDCALLG